MTVQHILYLICSSRVNKQIPKKTNKLDLRLLNFHYYLDFINCYVVIYTLTLGSHLRYIFALVISGFLLCGSSSTAAVSLIGLLPPTSFLIITANSIKTKKKGIASLKHLQHNYRKVLKTKQCYFHINSVLFITKSVLKFS